jgi:DNA-binding MarR family transcriptional regulator
MTRATKRPVKRKSNEISNRDGASSSTVTLTDMLRGGDDRQFRETVFLMVRALGHLEFCREAFGKRVGLTGSQFAVLVGVAYCQGDIGVTIRDLSRHVRLAATHITTEVGRLEAKGILSKRANEKDRRSVLVRLAPAGEKLFQDLAPFMREVNDILFSRLTSADMTRLHAILLQFADNGERAAEFIRRRENY